MDGKPVSASAIVDQVVEISSHDLETHGSTSGGKLMQVVENLAAAVAKRHTGQPCIPMGIDSVRFLNSPNLGDLFVCKAAVNRTWDSSMEIGIKVVAEDFRSLEEKDILSAYFTFVAVDAESKPVEVMPVIPETPDELSRFAAAEKRH